MSDVVQRRLQDCMREAHHGAQVVLLQGEIGRGKTYAVQQFYDALCDSYGHDVWQRGLTPTAVPTSTQELLLERKNVRGLKSAPISAQTPWLWIAATCSPRPSGFDAAAADLGDQLDEFVRDLGYEAAWNAASVLGSGLADVASDLLGISTAKTIAETVRGLARVAKSEYDSRPDVQERALRAQRSALVGKSLRRLGVDKNRDGTGKPLIAVLDDAHLAGPESLLLLSSLLMPAGDTAEESGFFPEGVAARQNPVLVVLCRWTHTDQAPAYADSPLHEWLRQAKAAGVPVTVVDVPNGLTRQAAGDIAATHLPALSDDDRQLVVGADSAPVVNPLVLKMRIGRVSGYLDDPARATSLAGIDTARLPVSPLDPVRDLFEALPLTEKRAVLTLAAFGGPAPLRLLSDVSDPDPGAVLPQALKSGLVASVGEHEDVLQVLWFTDDLSVAYFQSPELLFSSPREAESEWAARFSPWLSSLAVDDRLPVSVLPSIGGVLLGTFRRHRTRPEVASLISCALTSDEIEHLGARRSLVMQRFRHESDEWTQDELGRQILACVVTPKVLGSQTWAVMFATASARRFIEKHPRALGSRAIALSRRTMPCLELKESLLGAVPIDGEIALSRLAAIAGLLPDFDFASEVANLGELPAQLARPRSIAIAQATGRDQLIEFFESDPPRTVEEAIALADAYAAVGRFGDAVKTLSPLSGTLDFAVRAARLALHAGDRETARTLLAPHAPTSMGATLALADAQDDVEGAIALLTPHLDANPEARTRASKLYAQHGRYDEAIAVLLPIEHSGPATVRQALRSLRARRPGTPREELLDAAEQAWKAGDHQQATGILDPALDDPAILSVWSEYAWLLEERSRVVTELSERVPTIPTLSMTLGELASEAPAEARDLGWLDLAHPGDQDLWLSSVRLVHQVDGNEGVRAEGFRRDGRLRDQLVRLVEAVERAGSEWESDRRLALTLERMGHVDWALDVMTPWSRRGPGEAHALRLFVDYGRLDLASERLFTTRNGSATMASARAMWHLAHDDADEAARAFRECSWGTPQVRRLGEILGRIRDDPHAALEASTLLSQMRQHSTAVSVLAAALRAYENPDVARVYKRARYSTPEAQRRAYGRHRRRYAIRAAMAAVDDESIDDADAGEHG